MNSSEPELWVIIQNYELLWIVIHILVIVFIYQITSMIIMNYPEPELWITEFRLFLGLPSIWRPCLRVWRHVWSQRLLRGAFCVLAWGQLSLEDAIANVALQVCMLSPSALHSGLPPRQSVSSGPRQVHLWRAEARGRRCHWEPLSTNGTGVSGEIH